MKKDFKLKIRLNNIFWSLGCYTRLEVKLAEYSLQEKIPMELTDLDVLGIRILPDLSIDYLIADCTSNKDVIRSPIQRVFWLKGVMEFLGASKGYLSLGTNNPVLGSQRIVGHRLGVTILNEENLANLEKRVVSSGFPQLKSSKPESWLYFENNITNLSKEIVPLLNFRKHNYWINPSYQNLHALISLVTKHNKLFNETNRLQKALILDLLTLFTLSVLQMSAYVFRVNPESPRIELRSYFYGGYDKMKRRQDIAENIKKLMATTRRQGTLFNETLKLDPDYLPNLFDIAFRLLNKPFDSSQIPRYLQVILFEKILYKGENADGMKYLETSFSDITKKLTRDIVKFFRDSTGISERLVEDVY